MKLSAGALAVHTRNRVSSALHRRYYARLASYKVNYRSYHNIRFLRSFRSLRRRVWKMWTNSSPKTLTASLRRTPTSSKRSSRVPRILTLYENFLMVIYECVAVAYEHSLDHGESSLHCRLLAACLLLHALGGPVPHCWLFSALLHCSEVPHVSRGALRVQTRATRRSRHSLIAVTS